MGRKWPAIEIDAKGGPLTFALHEEAHATVVYRTGDSETVAYGPAGAFESISEADWMSKRARREPDGLTAYPSERIGGVFCVEVPRLPPGTVFYLYRGPGLHLTPGELLARAEAVVTGLLAPLEAQDPAPPPDPEAV